MHGEILCPLAYYATMSKINTNWPVSTIQDYTRLYYIKDFKCCCGEYIATVAMTVSGLCVCSVSISNDLHVLHGLKSRERDGRRSHVRKPLRKNT